MIIFLLLMTNRSLNMAPNYKYLAFYVLLVNKNKRSIFEKVN